MAAPKTENTHKKGKKFPWRKKQSVWEDTMFEKKLLANPSLMTSHELADALKEYQEYRRGIGKYEWKEDPIAEHAEVEAPFSPKVLGRLLDEAIVRLLIGGDLALGRKKNEGCRNGYRSNK